MHAPRTLAVFFAGTASLLVLGANVTACGARVGLLVDEASDASGGEDSAVVATDSASFFDGRILFDAGDARDSGLPVVDVITIDVITADTAPPPSDARFDAPPDLGATILARGNYFMLDEPTFTTDGFFAAENADTTTLQAIPLAGGAPIDIVASGDSAFASGDVLVVYSQTTFSGMAPKATLGTWTRAGGYHELSKTAWVGASPGLSYLPGTVAVSVDGSTIGWVEVATSASGASLVVSDLAGASKHVIAPDAVADASCIPTFAAATSAVVVAYCPSAGSKPALEGYASSGSKTFATSAFSTGISSDSKGAQLFFIDPSRNAAILSTDSGASIVLGPSALSGTITAEGSDAIWIGATSLGATAGTLYSSSTTAPAPRAIGLGGDVAQIFRPAPGARRVEYATSYDPRTGESDVNLAVIDGSGPPRVVSSDPTSVVFGDTTTADDQRGIYVKNVTSGAGDLYTVDLSAASATPMNWASMVWWAFAPHDTALLFNENWRSGGNGNEGVADIWFTGGFGSSRGLFAGAENNFYLTPDRKRFVFASSDPSIVTSGVYVSNVP